MTINFILWLSCGLMGNMGKGNSPDDIIEWTFYYRFSKNPKRRNIEYDTWFHIPRTWINFPAARCLKNRVLGKPELVLRHGDLHQSEMCIHIYENVCFWGRRSNNLALSCWRPLKVAQLWGDNIGRVRRNILRRSDPLNYRIHDAGNLLHAPLAAKCPTVRQQIRLNLSKYCRSDRNRESERKKKQQHWNALLGGTLGDRSINTRACDNKSFQRPHIPISISHFFIFDGLQSFRTKIDCKSCESSVWTFVARTLQLVIELFCN